MSGYYQAILLIAFGGPTCPEEIRPFLSRVTKNIPIPPERLEEVAHHYEAVGGKSPLNEITFRQAKALEALLEQRNRWLPVYVGMRNGKPFFSEALKQMEKDGIKQALGFILSSHRSEASWERYQKNIADARAELEDVAPVITFTDGWHDHPLFIRVWVESIQSACADLPASDRHAIPLVFTAHSIPASMAARSPYVEQIATSARLIAEQLGHSRWSIAYQSRSGRPTDPWLEPDIARVIEEIAGSGSNQMVVAPIGFVCDHVEVLYDLDIEAKERARQAGVDFIRASCPNDHPTFIRTIGDVIEKKINSVEDRA